MLRKSGRSEHHSFRKASTSTRSASTPVPSQFCANSRVRGPQNTSTKLAFVLRVRISSGSRSPAMSIMASLLLTQPLPSRAAAIASRTPGSSKGADALTPSSSANRLAVALISTMVRRTRCPVHELTPVRGLVFTVDKTG